jgi:hypothetical protein
MAIHLHTAGGLPLASVIQEVIASGVWARRGPRLSGPRRTSHRTCSRLPRPAMRTVPRSSSRVGGGASARADTGETGDGPRRRDLRRCFPLEKRAAHAPLGRSAGWEAPQSTLRDAIVPKPTTARGVSEVRCAQRRARARGRRVGAGRSARGKWLCISYTSPGREERGWTLSSWWIKRLPSCAGGAA